MAEAAADEGTGNGSVLMTMTAWGPNSSLPTPQPDVDMSEATFLLLQQLTNCGLNVLLLLLGVPANVVSAAVFWRQGLGDRMNACLFCLALVDSLYLATAFSLGAHCLLAPRWPRAASLLRLYGRYYLAVFSEGLMHSSALVTVLLSVERCLVVVLPMKAASLLKTRSMALLLLAACLTVHLLCCSAFVKRSVTVTYHTDTGLAVAQVRLRQVYQRSPQLWDGLALLVSVVLKVGTLLVVAVATAVTVFSLHRAMAWRHASSTFPNKAQADRSQLALVKMLVVISAIYLACAVPSVVVTALRALVAEFQVWGPYPRTVITCLMMAQLFTKLNSAVNFPVYLARSSRFRRVLLQMLPCLAPLVPVSWSQAHGAQRTVVSRLKEDTAVSCL